MKKLLILLLTGCAHDYDAGLQANLQTKDEYARFLVEHPCYRNPNPGYVFNPENGGWQLK